METGEIIFGIVLGLVIILYGLASISYARERRKENEQGRNTQKKDE